MWLIYFFVLRFLIIKQVQAQELVAETRIVGGTGVAAGERPFQVSLQKSSHFCGGSVLNTNYVVTAAHCLVGEIASNIRVVYGTVNLRQPYVSRRGTKIIVHRNYQPNNSFLNDIALLKVNQPVVYDDYIQPVTLPRAGSVLAAGTQVVMSGWGNLVDPKSGTPDNLQEVSVSVISNSKCEREMEPKGYNIQSTQQCTQDSERKGQCNGDSGGPVTVGSKTLVGIVSFSIKDPKCGSPTYPAVQTRVSDYRTWLSDNAK